MQFCFYIVYPLFLFHSVIFIILQFEGSFGSFNVFRNRNRNDLLLDCSRFVLFDNTFVLDFDSNKKIEIPFESVC